jgi:hypothetical protein
MKGPLEQVVDLRKGEMMIGSHMMYYFWRMFFVVGISTVVRHERAKPGVGIIRWSIDTGQVPLHKSDASLECKRDKLRYPRKCCARSRG